MKYIVFFLLFPFLALSQNKGVSPISNSEPSTASKNTYAVVIGISDYQDPSIPDLRFADKDAEVFANFLRSPAGGGLDNDHLRLLTNSNATSGKVATALYWLVDESKAEDQVIIYFSGHGDVERKFIGQPGFLLCWDSPFNVYMAGGSIELGMLQAVISTLTIEKKSKVLVITDACHSGKLAGSTINGSQITNSNLARQFGNEIKILSCQPNEFSLEGNQWGGGRGVFSYHLVNGLYGMANHDNDDRINLKEIGRYLEDFIPKEAAPENQNPIIVGDKETNVSKIFPDLIAAVRQNINMQMPSFLPVENRGLEDEILSELDTNSKKIYFLFNKSLEDKTFFEPINACSEYYFEKLFADVRLTRLHNAMRRNYAAALQDDAQQILNKLLKMDKSVNRFSIKTIIENYQDYPKQLDRAADLLGHENYLFSILKARKHYFIGCLIKSNSVENNSNAYSAAHSYFEATRLQPEFPQAYNDLAFLYGNHLRNLDSMEIFGTKAILLAPTWIAPYLTMAFCFGENEKFDLSKKYIDMAAKIDSNSVYVMEARAIDYLHQGKYKEAEYQFKKVLQIDSTITAPHANLGLIYSRTNRDSIAEFEFKKAIFLDSTKSWPPMLLGKIYLRAKRFMEAEIYFNKSISLDSNFIDNYYSLGILYQNTNQFNKAEILFKKAIELDSTSAISYYCLANFYFETNNSSEAEIYCKKSINLGYKNALRLLGDLYLKLNRTAESKLLYEQILKENSNAPNSLLGMSIVYIREGNIPKAFEYLQKSLEAGFSKISRLEKDSDFSILRELPEWNAMMKKYFPEKIN